MGEDWTGVALLATAVISMAVLVSTITGSGADDFMDWLYSQNPRKLWAAAVCLLSVIGFVWWLVG